MIMKDIQPVLYKVFMFQITDLKSHLSKQSVTFVSFSLLKWWTVNDLPFISPIWLYLICCWFFDKLIKCQKTGHKIPQKLPRTQSNVFKKVLGFSETKMLVKHDYFKGVLGLITNKGDCKTFYLEKKKTFISQYGLHMTWHSPTQRHTCCLPSAWCSLTRDSYMKRTLLKSTRCHQRIVFAHSRWHTAVRSGPQ